MTSNALFFVCENMAAAGRLAFEGSVWNESLGSQMYGVYCTHFRHCSDTSSCHCCCWSLSPLASGHCSHRVLLCPLRCARAAPLLWLLKARFIVSSKPFYLPLLERPRLFSPREQVRHIMLLSVSCTSPRERAEVVV